MTPYSLTADLEAVLVTRASASDVCGGDQLDPQYIIGFEIRGLTGVS
jgi:hypothetical protein